MCCRQDNGPTTSELQNGGSVGPFVGRWAAQVIPDSCYVCPSDYIQTPTAAQPRRCTTKYPVPGTDQTFRYAFAAPSVCVLGSRPLLSDCSRRSLDGIPCSSDLGLGSTWEANLRMPAFARWPGRIAAGSVSMEMVSTLDIFATVSPALGFAEGQRPTTERCDYRAWHWRACRCRRTA